MITWRKLLMFMTGVFTHMPNRVFNIPTFAFALWNGNLDQYSDLWFFKKLRKNLVNMNSNWFLSTIVAYRYYNPVSWFPLRKKQLNHDPTEFTARKQRSVSDQWTRQDQKSLFKYIPNWANTLQWINSLHEKMKFARQFTYFREKRIIMILLHR